MNHLICRVSDFRIVGPYTLDVMFDDGSNRVIDFRPVLGGELFGPLQRLDLFDRVVIDRDVHTLVWPNGADFDPATLRRVHTASVNDWGAILWSDGEFYQAPLRESLEIYDRVGGGAVGNNRCVTVQRDAIASAHNRRGAYAQICARLTLRRGRREQHLLRTDTTQIIVEAFMFIGVRDDTAGGHVLLQPQPSNVPKASVIDAGIAASLTAGTVFDISGTAAYVSPDRPAGSA